MTALTNNCSAPGLCADLADLAPNGRVMVFGHDPGLQWNQQWAIVPVLGGFNVQTTGVGPGANPQVVIAGVNDNAVEQQGPGGAYGGVVFGGGPHNVFFSVPEPGVINQFRIAFAGVAANGANPGRPNLYWTIMNDLASTPVRLMPAAAAGNENTQLWRLA